MRNAESVQLLIQVTTNFNVHDKKGLSPFDLAVKENSEPEIMQAFRDAGVTNKSFKNPRRRSLF
jgi:ankyrin repeat protein